MRLIPILLVLIACDVPGPHFRGIPATKVTVEDSTFDVRVRDRLGEAVRTNAQYAPRFGLIAGRAKIAIEHVSGCTVKEMRGDQAQALGVLDCGQGAPVAPEILPGRYLTCHEINTFVLSSTGERVTDYDCTWS